MVDSKLSLSTARINIATVVSAFFFLCHVGSISAETLPARVKISADADAGVSRIVVYMEKFDSASANFLQPHVYPSTQAQPVEFLREFYKRGRAGDLPGVLKLHSPELRDDVTEAFKRAGGLKRLDDPSPELRAKEMLFWDDFREVNVDHQRTLNSDQWFHQTHMFKCSRSECQFVRDREWDQLGFNIGYMYVKEHGKPVLETKSKYVRLELHSKQPSARSLPIVLDLVPLDSKTDRQLHDLFASLIKAVNLNPSQAKDLDGLFDAGIPTNYAHMSPTNTSGVSPEYSWDAFMLKIRRKKVWQEILSFSVTRDNALYLVRSSDGENFIFPMRKVNGKWKLVSDPSRSPWWSIVQTRAFDQAVGKLSAK